MRRTNASASPRTPRQSNRKDNPLGDETEEDHTSSYQSPSPDRNVTNYSEPNTTPRRPVVKKTARKSTAPRRTNETTRSPREMELTRGANRDTRSSVGPNRSRDYEPRPGPSKERKQPKPKRMKPGTAALKEIRKLQNTVHNLIPKLPFSRVISSS
uniref:CSON006310 protein n=1 Tax=Culicoides sonorensis TaxID=179676 RepID=A0A336MSB3_CULSO